MAACTGEKKGSKHKNKTNVVKVKLSFHHGFPEKKKELNALCKVMSYKVIIWTHTVKNSCR